MVGSLAWESVRHTSSRFGLVLGDLGELRKQYTALGYMSRNRGNSVMEYVSKSYYLEAEQTRVRLKLLLVKEQGSPTVPAQGDIWAFSWFGPRSCFCLWSDMILMLISCETGFNKRTPRLSCEPPDSSRQHRDLDVVPGWLPAVWGCFLLCNGVCRLSVIQSDAT